MHKGSFCIIFTTACESTIALIKTSILKSLHKHCHWYERNKSTLLSVLILIRCTFWVSRIRVFSHFLMFYNLGCSVSGSCWKLKCSITSCCFPQKYDFSSLERRINIKQSLLLKYMVLSSHKNLFLIWNSLSDEFSSPKFYSSHHFKFLFL